MAAITVNVMALVDGVMVSLDCTNARALAEFWAGMLDGEIAFTTAAGTVGVRTDWIWIAAIEVADYTPPTWPDPAVPKQIHLDLGVADQDVLEGATAHALDLGARLADHQPAPQKRRILLDPAGHPFCLTTQMPPQARAAEHDRS